MITSTPWLACVRYSGVVKPQAIPENGDPCPLSPRGGNLEAATAVRAWAAVLTMGTMIPLLVRVSRRLDHGEQCNYDQHLDSLRSTVECSLDERWIVPPDPYDRRDTARCDGIDTVVHVRISYIACEGEIVKR